MVEQNECFKCGASGEKVRLFDAISEKEKGVVKICETCSFNENIPIIRKPTTFQLKECERKSSVYERLARSAGIDPQEHMKKMSEEARVRERELKKQEIGMKDLIDKKLKIKYSKPWAEKKPRPDLIDNFHWIIMRARKSKHITNQQLGDAIAESAFVIKMAEQGKLPEDDYRLINKLENYFGIRLRKLDAPPYRPLIKREPVRILGFKKDIIQNLTISDLQRMKHVREQEEIEEQIGELEKEKWDREDSEENAEANEDETKEESVEEMEERIRKKLREER